MMHTVKVVGITVGIMAIGLYLLFHFTEKSEAERQEKHAKDYLEWKAGCLAQGGTFFTEMYGIKASCTIPPKSQ